MAAFGAAVLFGLLWFERHFIANATTRDILVLGGIAVCLAAILGAVALANVILPLLADRSAGVADVLHAVAHGDLTRDPVETGDGPHDDRIVGATRTAITALRASIGEVRTATRELASRAQDLTLQHAGAVSAAQRSTELGASAAAQGTTLAQQLAAAHEDAGQFAAGAALILDEARALRARDQRLRQQSRDSLSHLERGASSLEELTHGVSASAEELAVLAGASEEIRSFVILVRKMARQSKLLALNAAMEAARAGEHGSGFAVVAGEVRRLAKSSNEAADRTDHLVTDVLERLEKVRASSARAVDALRVVSESNAVGMQVLRQLETDAGSAIESAAHSGDDARVIMAAGDALSLRLEQLSREAEALSHALQDSSTGAGAQQSRLQEMAAAISALARAATRVQTAANAFQSPRPDDSDAAAQGSARATFPDALRGAVA